MTAVANRSPAPIAKRASPGHVVASPKPPPRSLGSRVTKALSLSQGYRAARDLARELRLEARRGRDVVAERRAELSAKREQERAERDRDRRLLGKLIGLYLADAEAKLRPATMREVRRYLRIALAPLHDHDADRLEARTVAAILADIAKERGRTSANRARSYLSACLSYGVATGVMERNILIGTKRPQPEQRRDRVLSEGELRAVWLASSPATDFGSITRLLMLLGQRREEVGGMLWSELDLDRALWRLPGARTKNHRAHDVPLPPQAVALLAARRRLEGRDAVFGRSVAGVGFSGWSKAKAELDTEVKLPEWKLHDLRRSTVTHMAEIGVEPSIIEAVVNHISGARAGVAGTYNRATYATPKRAALQRWADHLDRIIAGEAGDNVVAFGR